MAAQIHAFIQLLGNLHGFGRGEAQLAVSVLLQGGGGEGRGRMAQFYGLFHRNHPEKPAVYGRGYLIGFLFAVQLGFFAVYAEETGRKDLSFVAFQKSGDGPVFLGDKFVDFFFPFHNDSGGNRLNPSCRNSAADRFPKVRRELISDDTVQNPAGDLGIDQIHIDLAGSFDGGFYRTFGHLVEGDPFGLLGIQLQSGTQVPGNGFAFPVRVGSQIDRGCLFGLLLELLDQFSFSPYIDEMGLKIVFGVHCKGGFGQIPYMSYRCHHFVSGAQVAFQTGSFCGRFDDYQICHKYSFRFPEAEEKKRCPLLY